MSRCVIAWPYGATAAAWCGRKPGRSSYRSGPRVRFEDAGHASAAISVEHSGGPAAHICPDCAAALAKLFAPAAKETA
jgi:hypothetical protein